MENTRATYLINKSNLDDKEKQFLIRHLEIYEDRLQTVSVEVIRLKDIIDYGQYLNNKILDKKEELVDLINKDNKERLLDFLNNLIKDN